MLVPYWSNAEIMFLCSLCVFSMHVGLYFYCNVVIVFEVQEDLQPQLLDLRGIWIKNDEKGIIRPRPLHWCNSWQLCRKLWIQSASVTTSGSRVSHLHPTPNLKVNLLSSCRCLEYKRTLCCESIERLRGGAIERARPRCSLGFQAPQLPVGGEAARCIGTLTAAAAR